MYAILLSIAAMYAASILALLTMGLHALSSLRQSRRPDEALTAAKTHSCVRWR